MTRLDCVGRRRDQAGLRGSSDTLRFGLYNRFGEDRDRSIWAKVFRRVEPTDSNVCLMRIERRDDTSGRFGFALVGTFYVGGAAGDVDSSW